MRSSWVICRATTPRSMSHSNPLRHLYNSSKVLPQPLDAIPYRLTMASHNTDPPSLSTIPEELCLSIIEKMDMSSIIALSQTNRFFNRLSDPTEKSRRSELEDFSIEVQSFPRWQDGFACFSCAKVLPRHSFASGQTKLRRGRNGTRQNTRFCIQCGVRKGLYVPGSMVVQDDIVRMVCRQCLQLRGGRFCQRCTICSYCDRNRGTLEECTRDGPWKGHKIVGEMLPSQ